MIMGESLFFLSLYLQQLYLLVCINPIYFLQEMLFSLGPDWKRVYDYTFCDIPSSFANMQVKHAFFFFSSARYSVKFLHLVWNQGY